MYQTVFLPAAKQDIREAANWYNEKQNGLGKRFTQSVKDKLEFIKSNPLASINRYKYVRTAILDVFPFMVHYYVDPTKNQIVVLGIFHTSRNPDKWEKR